MSEEKQSLNDQLDKLMDELLPGLSEDHMDLIEKGYRRILDQDLESNALNVGETAPDFTLPNAIGNDVALQDLLTKGNVVLTFYRGAWCPYCSRQLHEYQKRLGDIQGLGAQLVAISPQAPDSSLSQSQKHNLEFEILSDHHNQVAAEFGLRFDMPEEHIELLEQVGASYFEFNHNDDRTVPVAATYVLDQQGVIRWCFVDRNYRRRAEPDDIIAALKEME